MPRGAFEAKWVSKLLFVIHNRQTLARFNQPVDWRTTPPAPVASAIHRDGLERLSMPKLGPGVF